LKKAGHSTVEAKELNSTQMAALKGAKILPGKPCTRIKRHGRHKALVEHVSGGDQKLGGSQKHCLKVKLSRGKSEPWGHLRKYLQA